MLQIINHNLVVFLRPHLNEILDLIVIQAIDLALRIRNWRNQWFGDRSTAEWDFIAFKTLVLRFGKEFAREGLAVIVADVAVPMVEVNHVSTALWNMRVLLKFILDIRALRIPWAKKLLPSCMLASKLRISRHRMVTLDWNLVFHTHSSGCGSCCHLQFLHLFKKEGLSVLTFINKWNFHLAHIFWGIHFTFHFLLFLLKLKSICASYFVFGRFEIIVFNFISE